MNKKKKELKIIKYIKSGFIIFNVLLILMTISSAAASQTPYSGTALKVPGIIQAEYFDKGGEGIAYHDSDTKNNGGAYRTGEGIDIEKTTDSGLGYDIGWIKAGEWMEYTTNITSSGTYDIEVRVARGGTGGNFHILFNGLDKTGTLSIPDTGGWQNWTTIKKTGVSLSKGTQIMKIVFDTNSPTGGDAGNINYIKIFKNNPPSISSSHSPSNPTTLDKVTITASATDDKDLSEIQIYVDNNLKKTCSVSTTSGSCSYASTFTAGTHNYFATVKDTAGQRSISGTKQFVASNIQTPFSGVALKVPGIIQVEDYDNGSEGIAYHDSDTQNNGESYRIGEGVDIEQTIDSGLGYDIGWIKAGEWMEYTTNITSSGTYDIEVRVARGGTGGNFHIEFNGLDKTGTLTIPDTGGWQNWTTMKKTGVSLSKGTQIMKIVFDTNSPTGEDAGNINYVKISLTAPANIITNPGFEIGSTTPAKWSYITNNGNTPVWESTTAHTGTKSVKISVSSMTDGISGELWYDNIPSTSGTTYMLSAWGKSQGIDGTNNPAVRVAEFNINNILLRQTSLYFPKGTADWNQLQTTFTTGADTAYINVYANIWNGFGTFYVDDVSLTTLPTPITTPAPTPTPTATPVTTPAPTSTPAPVNGPKYYVATNGNDGNSGLSSSPWRTIQHAADTVSAGDTVYVMGGTYNEKVAITKSGSSGNYITFAAYPGQSVSIDGTGISLGSWDGLIRINGASYIQISGFKVLKSSYVGIMVSGGSPSNINIQNNYINGAYSSGIYAERASSITIDNNEIIGAHSAGAGTENEIVSLVHVNGFDVKNNKIHDNVNTESINAKMGSSNGRIHHNNIKPTSSAGIYLDPFTEYQENVEVYDNIIHDGPGASRGIAVAVEGGGTIKYVKIYNNLVYRNGANGIVVDYYADCGNDPGTLCLSGTIDNILIEGNTVYQNNAIGWDGGIINKYEKSTNVVIRNNIVSQNYGNQIWVVGSNTIQNNLIDGSTGTNGNSYKTGSPQFVNPSSGDFHIQSTSPAINNGATPMIAIVDFDGKSRPQGGGYDIGAYEY